MTAHQERRRRFLQQVIAVVPVSTAVTVTQSACSSRTSPEGPATATGPADSGAMYYPTFFTSDEWTFIRAAVDRLVPEDELGAGALKAGVPEYIDRQMETPYGHGKLWYMQGPFHPDQAPEMGYQMSLTPRDIYRNGIRDCDAYCRKQYGGRIFAQLDHASQEAVFHAIEANTVHFDSLPARTFFSCLLGNTKEGFFADPIYGGNKGMVGWKMVGFPGARADFADWIDQPGAHYPYGPVSIDGRRG
ncbi:gluconate 2-dehydrogenase subunit 3 family protein [Paraburkholderia sp. J10-1]|uniref:gluconate 2-dehydrogenase subunit 3 family protein n=1 Tax=Paraburkholderia sp. J10-1 TaxID=2805430 RepID=UPI002AB77C5B|nr:gluconate 2-dehydrogenase subunit 3 family protein [Paraburkholderia sp. J10-1]